MHRSIYISKNNGINIVCLLVKLYFGQVLPLLIRRPVPHPTPTTEQTVWHQSRWPPGPSIVRKRFLFINGVTIIFGKQAKFCSGSRQPERKGKNGSQSLKGEHRQLYIKVRLCVLWSFATYVKERSMEPFAALQGAVQIQINWCHLRRVFFFSGRGGEEAFFFHDYKFEKVWGLKKKWKIVSGCWKKWI